jgi:glycosyltransferase involved in cell wall biosynthesis
MALTTATRSETTLRILGFGTYDAAKHPRAGTILEGLCIQGDEVVEANAPLGFTTAERVAMLAKPWSAYRLVARIWMRWRIILRQARRARRSVAFDAVIVGYMGHFDVVLARARFPRDTVVLDLLVFAADTARDRGVRSGLRLQLLEWLDALAIRCADVVVVDTVEHAAMLAPGQRRKAEVVAVGASDAWFAAGAGRRQANPAAPLRVVFFGLFTPLHGAPVIGAALGLLADCGEIEATMIGSGQEWDVAYRAAAGNDRVTWLDWVEPALLPTLVADHDVCLCIFGTTPKAWRVVPNKVYQGAAAGCAVITSDTPPQRRALGEAAVFVPPGDAASLAEVLRELSKDRDRVAALGAAARCRGMAEFTAGAVVRPLRARLAAGARTSEVDLG